MSGPEPTGPWTSLGRVAQPTAVVDLEAFDANGQTLVEAADGIPIRVASKSIRVRGLIERALATDGCRGVLCYSAAEAKFLAGHGIRDIVVAYPSVDTEAMAAIAVDPVAALEVTFMVDLAEHVRLVAGAAHDIPLRVAIDVDCSLRRGPVHIGVHRSSVRSPQDAGRLAALIEATDNVMLDGAMFYEAQVAGVPDSNAVIRAMKRRSLAELPDLRGRAVKAMRDHGELRFVNGGGTGSVAETAKDPVITDIAAGSGFFNPTLFDRYDGSTRRPAAYFVSPVTRKPSRDVVVTYSGGYLASGVADRSRVPTPVYPQGLRYFGQEGAGEVQTPLRGKAARDLHLGDKVWFRHTKAGEMCERFNDVRCVDGGEVVATLPTYRGEGRNFG